MDLSIISIYRLWVLSKFRRTGGVCSLTGWAGYYSEAIYPLLGGPPANEVRRPLSVDAQSIQTTRVEDVYNI